MVALAEARWERERRKQKGLTITPIRWGLGPNDFQATGCRVIRVAGAKTVGPAQVLLVDPSGFRHRTQGYREHTRTSARRYGRERAGKRYIHVEDAP